MDHNIEAIDKLEQARGRERMGFGLDTNTGLFQIIDVDSDGRQANKQYVWDTTSLGWVAANSAGGAIGGGGATALYSILLDQADASTLYVGEANPGTSASASYWRIRKVVDNVSVLWASGNTNFDKSWTNRASYVYS